MFNDENEVINVAYLYCGKDGHLSSRVGRIIMPVDETWGCASFMGCGSRAISSAITVSRNEGAIYRDYLWLRERDDDKARDLFVAKVKSEIDSLDIKTRRLKMEIEVRKLLLERLERR